LIVLGGRLKGKGCGWQFVISGNVQLRFPKGRASSLQVRGLVAPPLVPRSLDGNIRIAVNRQLLPLLSGQTANKCLFSQGRAAFTQA
jgi:hypothetical protein